MKSLTIKIMEKELNIAEILKKKSKGTKLYSSAIGECRIFNVGKNDIVVRDFRGNDYSFNKHGVLTDTNGECTLFPSNLMRDWAKFAWKKGDVLYAESIDNYCIFNKFADDEYTTFEGKFLFDARNLDICNSNYFYENTYEFVKVSDDNAKLILSNLASLLGGKLNLDTLKIEKSQFKDGDIFTLDSNETYIATIGIFKGYNNEGRIKVYAAYNIDRGIDYINVAPYDRTIHLATDSEKQQLFDALAKENKAWDAEKKQIVDLPKKCEFKPKDWCLMRFRGTNKDAWKLCQFGFFDAKDKNDLGYCAIGGNWFDECIPYNDQTAHLLGTTDDWEGR